MRVLYAIALILMTPLFAAVLFFLLGLGGLVMYQIPTPNIVLVTWPHTFFILDLAFRVLLFLAYVLLVSFGWSAALAYCLRSQEDSR